MATTPYPLVWEFARAQPTADGLTGVVHYYDEESQSLYLNGGLSTKTAHVELGQWDDATQSAEYQITDDSLGAVRTDHPSNGTLYFAAVGDNGLEFMRYTYMMDVSSIVDSWRLSLPADSPITEVSLSVKNIGQAVFVDDYTLFHPGARITSKFAIGDSEPIWLQLAWLDEVSYDAKSATVPLSGRNTIGRLKDQTFDTQNQVTGKSTDTARALLEMAGITKYIIAPSTQAPGTAHTFEFKPSDTLLSGVESMNDYYRADDQGDWTVRELPDGTILYGYDTWLDGYVSNSYYAFNVGSDIFTRQTKKASDGAYSHIYATGKDDNGNELVPQYIVVNGFGSWKVPGHKTKHISAETAMTQSVFNAWARQRAEELQYIGIGETFSSPFRPQLLPGDIAQIENGDLAVLLGLITQVEHNFSRSGGFTTSFAVDSGGVVVDGANLIVYPRVASEHGYNRKQTIADLIKIISSK